MDAICVRLKIFDMQAINNLHSNPDRNYFGAGNSKKRH